MGGGGRGKATPITKKQEDKRAVESGSFVVIERENER